MKKILTLLLLLSVPAWADTPISGLPTGSSLTGSEQLPMVQGSTTIRATAQAIANLGTGGATTGTIVVTAAPYSAACDAKVQLMGVHTTASSGTVSADNYQFQSSDVGATIVIWNPGFANNPISGTITNFQGTIASVSGGVITGFIGGATPSFTSASYKFAGAFWYHTDDTTALQAALNAAHTLYPGGGRVVFPGLCATQQLTVYSNTTLDGGNPGSGGVGQVNGGNKTLIKSYQFDSLVGTNSQAGVQNLVFNNFLVFGNRAANTATGTGTATAVGDGVQLYGTGLSWSNLYIVGAAADGWYSEWSAQAGTPAYSLVGVESVSGFNFQGWYNGGGAMLWNGSHDGRFVYMDVSGNQGPGLQVFNTSNATPLNVENLHGYQNNGYDIDFEGPYTSCVSCRIEGSGLINNFGDSLAFSGFNNLYFGNPSSGSNPVYGLNLTGTGATTLINTSGTGFDDEWIGGSVGTLTGTYTPSWSYGVQGTAGQAWGNQTGHYGSKTIFINDTSYAASISTDTSSNWTFSNGNQKIMIANANAQFKLGPAATAPNHNAGLDLGLMTTANYSSLILPQDSTANRPTTPIAGMIRYNTSTPGLEAYYGSAWNTLASTSAFVAGGASLTVASGCGTVTSVVGGSQVGGNVTGSFHAGATSCVPVLTLPTAPNGWICGAKDLTTPGDTFTQTATSTTSCTTTATVTSGDVILIDARWY